MIHKRDFRALLLAVAVLAYGSGSTAAPNGYPGPGEYRIDSDAVISMGGGRSATEQRIQTDGATGTVTTTVKALGAPPATQSYPGSKPVTWCVKAATPNDLPRNSPFACQTLDARSTTASSSFSAACRSADMDSTFQQIDPRIWEHTMTVRVRSDPDPLRSAREAMERAMNAPGMSAAQRAEAQKAIAEMPSQAELDRTRDEMRKEIEESIRTGSPEEADAARQAQRAMERALGGNAVLQTTRIKERWTLLSAACSTGR